MARKIPKSTFKRPPPIVQSIRCDPRERGKKSNEDGADNQFAAVHVAKRLLFYH